MDEIKTAYRTLAKKWHPGESKTKNKNTASERRQRRNFQSDSSVLLSLDVNPGKDTTVQFQEINHAYEVLTKQHERFGDQGRRRGGGGKYAPHSPNGGGFGWESDKAKANHRSPFATRGRRVANGKPFDGYTSEQTAEDRQKTAQSPFWGSSSGGTSDKSNFSNGSVGGGYRKSMAENLGFDPFTNVGGVGGTGSSTMGGGYSTMGFGGRVIVGEDVRLDLEVDYKTSIFGGDVKVNMTTLMTCITCEGGGAKPGTKVATCDKCGGTGTMVKDARSLEPNQKCPACSGAGKVIASKCDSCNGKGASRKTRQITVKVPGGVESGSRLCIGGSGDAGPNGGPAGDLYIFLKVKPDPRFRLEGSDIYSNATISYLDSITGGSITTPGIDGDVTIQVPPGTQDEQILRLEGNGAPLPQHREKRGNQYITMHVEAPPEDLSKEEEELIEKLRLVRQRGNLKSMKPDSQGSGRRFLKKNIPKEIDKEEEAELVKELKAIVGKRSLKSLEDQWRKMSGGKEETKDLSKQEEELIEKLEGPVGKEALKKLEDQYRKLSGKS